MEVLAFGFDQMREMSGKYEVIDQATTARLLPGLRVSETLS